jgi:acetyl-CoA carboxylase carboxyl transferase subunit alpha
MEVLPLERPLLELNKKIFELRNLEKQQKLASGKESFGAELNMLESQFEALAKEIFSKLSAYEISQLSRHPNRPYTLDVVKLLASDFIELQGDRNFMDDASVVGGLAILDGRRVMVVGHQKGRGTKENIRRNFGMPRPEGYRKALRLMTMAARYNLPIITFIDTPGAYPGMDAEERGQSEAIAKNIMVMFRLPVPIVTVVLGEGGSGGALAIGVGNRLLMMQLSTFSVISPEGCASILWKDGSQADRAAEALKLTAQHALSFGVADEVIEEPLGGAHWNQTAAITNLGIAISKHLKELEKLTPNQLLNDRREKYAKIGVLEAGDAISPFRGGTPHSKSWEDSWETVNRSLHNFTHDTKASDLEENLMGKKH